MVDLFQTPSPGPTLRRRGRPPGARSKRSLDLARYIEARFAGMTPGQQLAELAMVTAKDLKAAGGSMLAAYARRAELLALELGLDKADALAVLVKALTELMPYVHQKRAIAPPEAAGAALPVMFVAEAGDMRPGELVQGDAPDVDLLEDFSTPQDLVGRAQSDDDA